MAEERAIIYKVSAEIGDLTRKAAEVQTAIDALKVEQAELVKSGQKNTVEFQNNSTALRNLQREYKNTTAAIDQNVRAVQGAEGSYERLLNETKLLETKLKTLPDAFDKNNKVAQALTKQIDLNKTALLGLNATIQDGRLNVGNYGNTISGLKAKYAELQASAERLDLGSVEFERVQKEIVKTRDQLGLAQGKFDEFGDKIKKGGAETLDTFNDVGQGLVAAYSLAPLFGENQEAAQLQANALKAIAVAQNAVAVSKGIANLREAAGIVVTKASLIATQANTLGQKAYAAAVGTATGATKALRVVLASTGILAVVGLLVMAADAMGAFSDKTEEATEQQKKFKDAQAEVQKQLAENNAKLIEDDVKRAIKLREQQAKEERAILIRQRQDNLIIERDFQELEKQSILLELRDIAKIREEAAKKEQSQGEDAVKKAQDRADKIFEINRANQENLLKLQNKGARLELKLFDLETEALIRAAKKRGEDLEALALVRLQERQEIEQKVTEETVIKPAEKEIQTQSEVIESGFAKFNEASKRRMAAAQAEEDQKKRQAEKDKELNQQKAQGASDLAGSLIGALSTTEEASKRNAEAIKVLSVSQAIISGLVAVQKALASAPPPINFIQAGVVGVASAANVAKLIATPAFAKGGLTGKRISWSDGTPTYRPNGDNLLATVKVGEVILNQKQQAAIGGPRTFRKIGVPGFADGGFVNDQIQQSINASIDMQGLKRIMENVRPEVSVVEISKKTARVKANENVRTL